MTPPKRRNERLRAAMRAAGISYRDLGKAVGRNTKSVQRWVYDGRIPHKAAIRRQVAQILDVAESGLWPGDSTQVVLGRTAEIYLNAETECEGPSISIYTDSLELVLAPRAVGEPLTVRDATIWRNLAGACAAMADEVARNWAAQTKRPAAAPLPELAPRLQPCWRQRRGTEGP